MSDSHLDTAFSLPSGFTIREVSNLTAPRLGAGAPAPSLGAVRFDTSLIVKPLGSEKAVSRCESLMVLLRPGHAVRP